MSSEYNDEVRDGVIKETVIARVRALLDESIKLHESEFSGMAPLEKAKVSLSTYATVTTKMLVGELTDTIAKGETLDASEFEEKLLFNSIVLLTSIYYRLQYMTILDEKASASKEGSNAE